MTALDPIGDFADDLDGLDTDGLDEPEVTAEPARRGLRLERGTRKVRRPTLMNFSRQLAAFLGAGIPITEALRILGTDTRDSRMKLLIDGLSSGIQRGSTIADSLETLPVQLPPYYVPMIRAGETTGRLDDVLMQLTGDLERDTVTRRKIRSAMTYPTVVMCVGMVVVLIMVSFVLPRFAVFFTSINADLPWMTRVMLSWGNLGTIKGLYLVLVVLLMALGAFSYARTERGRVNVHRLVLRLPVVGDMARFIAVERFCRSLGAMVRAGTSLPLALEVASTATGNRVFIERLGVARAAVIAGDGLADSIIATDLFPSAASQMIRVGEETGTIDDQLAVAAEFYERELSHVLGRFTTLFEAGIILAVGLAVGFVAIALVSAMFGMYQQVKF